MKPSLTFAAVALAWFLLGVAAFFSDQLSLVWLVSGLIILPIAIIDAIALYFFTDRLSVQRSISSYLAQDESTKVKLEIKRSGTGILVPRMLLWDLHPASMTATAFPAKLDTTILTKQHDIPHKKASLSFEYSLMPEKRGNWHFRGTELLLSSVCGLWNLKVFHPCESSGQTYPNFKMIQAAAGTDLRGLLERSGVKNIRMRGQGLEFQSLRDYQQGDSVRAVDWRATSRRAKVTIREYQEEKDQQLLFLLDSGYRLNRLEDTKRLQFDSALEALLLLSWVSLKHGDSVAVSTFGAQKRWLPPRKGAKAFPLLMNGLYDLASSSVPSSPSSALEDALFRLKRRTFIVLISNFHEEDGESLSWVLRHIEKRHLLLMVSLKEKEAESLARQTPSGSEEALETAAAFSYRASRRELYTAWEHSGLLTMECSAKELAPALINRYLEVKRSGRL